MVTKTSVKSVESREIKQKVRGKVDYEIFGKMTTHVLKTWTGYFEEVSNGSKTFEVRKADRDFKRGDRLQLMEWNPIDKVYTGRCLIVEITYYLPGGQFGIENEYCILGIKKRTFRESEFSKHLLIIEEDGKEF